MPSARKDKTCIWVPKQLRDELAGRAKWEQPLAAVIQQIIAEYDEYKELERQGKSPASGRVLVGAY